MAEANPESPGDTSLPTAGPDRPSVPSPPSSQKFTPTQYAGEASHNARADFERLRANCEKENSENKTLREQVGRLEVETRFHRGELDQQRLIGHVGTVISTVAGGWMAFAKEATPRPIEAAFFGGLGLLFVSLLCDVLKKRRPNP